MSAVVAAIFKYTVGLLVDKARTKAADELKDGDVTEEAFRNMVISKLDDIKSKLDGFARKDLLSSTQFLRAGIVNLNQVFSKSLTQGKDSETGVKFASNTVDSPGENFVDGSTLQVTERIRTFQRNSPLNQSARRSLKDAEKRFEDARRKATEAFSNEALSTPDRILALKIQVVATILERVDRPEDALEECKLCLEDLHAMPAVRENFKVQLSGGMRSMVNKLEREAVIVAVCQMNHVVFRIMQAINNGRGDGVVLPPLTLASGESIDVLRDERVVRKLIKLGVAEFCRGAWPLGRLLSQEKEGEPSLKQPRCLATDSQGQLIVVDESDSQKMKVYSSGGKFQKSFRLLVDGEVQLIHSLATDRNGNLFVLVEIRSSSPDTKRRLFAFDNQGVVQREFSLKEWFIGRTVALARATDQLFVLGGNILGIKFYIEVYNAVSGEFVRSFGQEALTHPKEIAAADDGRVFVLMDMASPRVHIFSSEGEHLHWFPLQGSYCSEGSIAVGRDVGKLVVSLWGRDCSEKDKLSVYTVEGEFVCDVPVFDPNEKKEAGHRTAQDVAVTEDGRIAVISWTTKGTFCKICQEIRV